MLANHSEHFSLEDSLAIGVDRMQLNFGPPKQRVEETTCPGNIMEFTAVVIPENQAIEVAV